MLATASSARLAPDFIGQLRADPAARLQADAETVVKGLLPISDDMAITLEEVRRLTKLATEGEGTIAQLLHNPDLYDSLDDAAVRLERTLVEIQLYIEKIKAEGLDIDF